MSMEFNIKKVLVECFDYHDEDSKQRIQNFFTTREARAYAIINTQMVSEIMRRMILTQPCAKCVHTSLFSVNPWIARLCALFDSIVDRNETQRIADKNHILRKFIYKLRSDELERVSHLFYMSIIRITASVIFFLTIECADCTLPRIQRIFNFFAVSLWSKRTSGRLEEATYSPCKTHASIIAHGITKNNMECCYVEYYWSLARTPANEFMWKRLQCWMTFAIKYAEKVENESASYGELGTTDFFVIESEIERASENSDLLPGSLWIARDISHDGILYKSFLQSRDYCIVNSYLA
jgi:hypothetical protein